MKLFLVVAMLLLPVAGWGASEWYVIESTGKKCVSNEGPSYMIGLMKSLGQSYKVVDEQSQNGKQVKVRLTINDGFQTAVLTYYRIKSLCQSEVAAMKRANDTELSKYR